MIKKDTQNVIVVMLAAVMAVSTTAASGVTAKATGGPASYKYKVLL